MDILTILKIIAALMTAATGLLAFLRPKSIEGFTGLTAPGARGITEFRAVFGGLFIAIGAAVLALNDPAAYALLGWGYLGIFVFRLGSMFFDKSFEQSNYISLATEIVLGVILIL